jgi:hypothetical protein
MAAIVIRENAKAACRAGRAGGHATACGMVRRAIDCAAATVIACAVGAVLVQLAAELVSFPAPVAVTAITVMAAALLNSLRRHIRTGRGTGTVRGTRIAASDKPTGSDRVPARAGRLPRLQPRAGFLRPRSSRSRRPIY